MRKRLRSWGTKSLKMFSLCTAASISCYILMHREESLAGLPGAVRPISSAVELIERSARWQTPFGLQSQRKVHNIEGPECTAQKGSGSTDLRQRGCSTTTTTTPPPSLHIQSPSCIPALFSLTTPRIWD